MKQRKSRYFQWLEGENQGTVETLKSMYAIDDEIFYEFESGESCNVRFIAPVTVSTADLKEKFMVEVNNTTNVWTFKTLESKSYKDESTGQFYEIPPIEDLAGISGQGGSIEKSNVGKVMKIAPQKAQRLFPLPDPSDWLEEEKEPVSEHISPEVEQLPTPEEKVAQKAENEPLRESPAPEVRTPEPVVPVQPRIVQSPVTILVDKCKKHPTEINLTLNIGLPGRSVFEIAANEFEDGAREFIDYVVSNIDLGTIVESLKEALTESYSIAEVRDE